MKKAFSVWLLLSSSGLALEAAGLLEKREQSLTKLYARLQGGSYSEERSRCCQFKATLSKRNKSLKLALA